MWIPGSLFGEQHLRPTGWHPKAIAIAPLGVLNIESTGTPLRSGLLEAAIGDRNFEFAKGHAVFHG
jgi:hypothetical protein